MYTPYRCTSSHEKKVSVQYNTLLLYQIALNYQSNWIALNALNSAPCNIQRRAWMYPFTFWCQKSNFKNCCSPFAEVSFAGLFPWPVSPGRWHRVHAEPELGWRHRDPAAAWQHHSSEWGCRPGSRGQLTAGGWPRGASGVLAHTGQCRKGPLSHQGCCLRNKRHTSLSKNKQKKNSCH